MAYRSLAQKIGARGHTWLAAKIESCSGWLVRELGEDYGIDLEVELTDDGVRGEILKLQIKSEMAVECKEGAVKFIIQKKYLDYAQSCRYPVIFVLVDIGSQEAWYVWLQDWLMRKQAMEGPLASTQQSWTTWIPEEATIERGLKAELRAVAAWKGQTQLVLSLIDAIRSAAALLNFRLIHDLTELVTKSGDLYGDASLAALIGEMIRLGDRMRGTQEGIEVSQRLFALVPRLGHRISRPTIQDMIIRGDSYSRIGLTALGILYDDFPAHLRTLDLPNYFMTVEPRVAYYCAFREAFPEEHSANVFVDPKTFTFAGLRYVQPERPWDRYANRGPSALLDYLEFIKAPEGGLDNEQ